MGHTANVYNEVVYESMASEQDTGKNETKNNKINTIKQN